MVRNVNDQRVNTKFYFKLVGHVKLDIVPLLPQLTQFFRLWFSVLVIF
jgi:hypothetical protein